ncbi:peroxisomal membrane protein PEX14 isoform X1 [Diachasma alloeum]|uniref:peroxisomal membrane protein PEX14 isoform X1 n=1 Tax=Diachasma alloeum TaxID=454923 RepID=UPI0007381E59|nr:peroxisomal membrane protein PEX14 isoform X1 [Diachasma alloeum]
MSDQEGNNNLSRETLISTAVKFLQNPKVSSSPLKQRQEFLLRKGLSEDEIRKACDLAGLAEPVNDFTSVMIPQNYVYQGYGYQVMQPTLFYRVKEFFNTAALIGATFYCVYWFYKKFIEPLLFGRKKDSIKDTVEDLDKTVKDSLKEMNESISKVESSVKRMTQHQAPDPTIPHLVQELKQDLASLKGLLLSRKQFPSAPPSIPPWQLEASTQSRDKAAEREDDAGSGSSTNNSDSSLEMIREDPPK